jgi:hypothetical protein
MYMQIFQNPKISKIKKYFWPSISDKSTQPVLVHEEHFLSKDLRQARSETDEMVDEVNYRGYFISLSSFGQ